MVDKICNIKFTDRPSLKIIEYCMKNNAKYCIIPIQDYLGLSDSEYCVLAIHIGILLCSLSRRFNSFSASME